MRAALIVATILVASEFNPSIVAAKGLFDALDGLIKTPDAITTSLDDAKTEAPELDAFEPKTFIPLTEMPRTATGGYYLAPGTYAFVAESYCLRAGAYRPSVNGPGYAYAPLRGSRAALIEHILQRSTQHPEIGQHAIQTVLWGIEAHANTDSFGDEGRAAASALLTPDEVSMINNGTTKTASTLLQGLSNNLPAPIRAALRVQAQLRDTFARGNATYGELERIAAPEGQPDPRSNVRTIPRNRWSKLPDGSYVRVFPNDYTNMLVQVYVPAAPQSFVLGHGALARSMGEGGNLRRFDGAGSGHLPGNSGGQRLGSSSRPYHGPNGRQSSSQALDTAKEADEQISDWTVNAGYATGIVDGAYGDIIGAIPAWMTSKLIEFNLREYGKASAALGGDPPRDDYTLIEAPHPSVEPMPPSGNASPVSVASAKQLLADFALLGATLRAGDITVDRLGGAEAHGDAAWSEAQAVHLIVLKRRAGILMQTLAPQLLAANGRLAPRLAKISPPSAAVLEAGRQRFARLGWSSSDREFALRNGWSKDDLERWRKELLARPWTIDSHAWPQSLARAARAWQALGDRWAALPDVSGFLAPPDHIGRIDVRDVSPGK